MKRKVAVWQFSLFAFVSLFGTLLHFAFDFFEGSFFAAAFSAVNESTFEHMKLLFWPSFVFAVLQSVYFAKRRDFWCIKLFGISLGLIMIPVLFYTLNGAVGKTPPWINIMIFFLSVFAMCIFESVRFKKPDGGCFGPLTALFIICVYALMFTVFTFVTPRLGLFMDPLTGSYGIG